MYLEAALVATFGFELDLLHTILLLLLHGGAGGVNKQKHVDNCERIRTE